AAARAIRRAVRPLPGPYLRLRGDATAQPGRRRGSVPTDQPGPLEEVGAVRPGPRLLTLGLWHGPLRGAQLLTQAPGQGPRSPQRRGPRASGPSSIGDTRRAGRPAAGLGALLGPAQAREPR